MRRWREVALLLIDEKLHRYEDKIEVFRDVDLDDLWHLLDHTLEDLSEDLRKIYNERLGALRPECQMEGVDYDKPTFEPQKCGNCSLFSIPWYEQGIEPVDSCGRLGNCLAATKLPYSMKYAFRERGMVYEEDGDKCEFHIRGEPQREKQ